MAEEQDNGAKDRGADAAAARGGAGARVRSRPRARSPPDLGAGALLVALAPPGTSRPALRPACSAQACFELEGGADHLLGAARRVGLALLPLVLMAAPVVAAAIQNAVV